MALFESLGRPTVSYSSSIITMAVLSIYFSSIITEIKRDIGRKSRFFHTPLAFNAPVQGSLRRSTAISFGAEKR